MSTQLLPTQTPQTNPTPASAHLQRLGVAATDELRVAVRISLTDMFGSYLGSLQDIFDARVRSTENPAGQQSLQAFSRGLEDLCSNWLPVFVRQVDAQLIGGITEGESKGSSSAGGGIESFAMADMELRAEERYEEKVKALDRALDQIRKTVYIPIFGKALAPAGLCRAFQDSADQLELSGLPRQVLLEQFDDQAIGNLDGLYSSVIDALARIDRAAAKAAANAPAKAWQKAVPTKAHTPAPLSKSLPRPTVETRATLAASPAPGVRPPAKPLELDSNTLSMLQQFAANDNGTGNYNDAKLATELLAIAADKSLKSQPRDQRWAPLQRLTMAGDFLNEAISDPLVPDEFKAQHETMRLPLVKSALADESFFTAVTHPLRSLVNDLMLRSATSRITGSAESGRIAELLKQVLMQFDLAPDFVREAMQNARPIPQAQMKEFHVMQHRQSQKRRETILGEAKRRVIRELELCTFGRAIPQPAIQFFNKRWGPLLVKRLVQRGVDNDQWKQGVLLMERALDLLENRDPAQAPPKAWSILTQSMAEALRAEGMASDPAAGAASALESAWTAA